LPAFLSDPPLALFLVLLVGLVAAGAVWWRTRNRKAAAAAGLFAFLLVLVFLIDRFVESPREEATRKIMSMADAATRSDPAAFVEHVSNRFNYQGASKDDVRKAPAWDAIRQYQATVAVWGFSRDDVETKGDTEVTIGFYAKGESRSHRSALVRYIQATFQKDPDGQYRLTGMKFYGVPRTTQGEEPIPGFPR
jgi:hypothetical protein